MNKKIHVDRNKLLKKLLKESASLLLDNLSTTDLDIKYTSSKVLIELSMNNPQKIYPFLNDFILLLNNKNNFIKWSSIIIIGNLARIDDDKKIDKILPKLYSLLNSGKMITANNTIQSLSKIALYKPYLQEKITKELLKVEKYIYDTKECNNIACGQVINGFESYLKNPNIKVLDFVSRQVKNSRHATSLKAQKYLKNIS